MEGLAATLAEIPAVVGREKKIIGKPGNCDTCGAPRTLKTYTRMSIWTPSCDCCLTRAAEEVAAEIAAAREKARRLKITSLFDDSGLGERFRGVRFADWRDRAKTREAYKAVRLFAGSWSTHKEQGTGLLLIGPTGTGKTTLLAMLLNELIATHAAAVVYQSAPDLLVRFKKTYSADSTETEGALLDALGAADLLILDDLGAAKGGEWAEGLLYLLVDGRYRRKRPIVATSNLSIGDLAQAIGQRTVSRLAQYCRIIQVQGEDARLTDNDG